MAKIAAGDVWVVLDDVQFVRRDYQHRARLAAARDPDSWQWLSAETHLPRGRATPIGQAELADANKTRQRMRQMITGAYRRSTHWASLKPIVDAVDEELKRTHRLADITQASTRAMLSALGWRGTVILSSDLDSRTDRNGRLIDIARAVGASTYVCGTGGMTYVDPTAFGNAGIRLVPFVSPTSERHRLWMHNRRVSALWALAEYGPLRVAAAIRGTAQLQGLSAPLPLGQVV